MFCKYVKFRGPQTLVNLFIYYITIHFWCIILTPWAHGNLFFGWLQLSLRQPPRRLAIRRIGHASAWNPPVQWLIIMVIWLLVDLPLWKILVKSSWDDDIPNWMESHKIHVPNHQPDISLTIKTIKPLLFGIIVPNRQTVLNVVNLLVNGFSDPWKSIRQIRWRPHKSWSP